MKALITNDDGATSALRLSLEAEGANDRTLMLLLEQQYPMIVRTRGGDLEVPIASKEIFDLLPSKIGLELDVAEEIRQEFRPGGWGGIAIVKSDPWGFATLRDVTLTIQNPENWQEIYLRVNGRPQSTDSRFDVYPGTIVEVRAQLKPNCTRSKFHCALVAADPKSVAPST